MYALTDKEETVLLFILSAIVQLVNDGSVQIEHSATTAATPKRRASTAVSAGGQGGNFMTTEEAVLAISRELLSLLPKLLLKFGAEYSSGLGQINLVTSLELIPFLDLGIYVDTRMTKVKNRKR